jgi:hypothetical protein
MIWKPTVKQGFRLVGAGAAAPARNSGGDGRVRLSRISRKCDGLDRSTYEPCQSENGFGLKAVHAI